MVSASKCCGFGTPHLTLTQRTFDIGGDLAMLSLRGPNSIPEVWVGGYRVVPDSER